MTGLPGSPTSPREPAEPPAPAPPAPRRVSVAEVLARFGLIFAWILVVAVFAVLEPDTFPTSGNLSTILGSQSVLLILSLALIVPLSAGEFDLSIAGIMGLSLVTLGQLNVVAGWPIGLAILAALAAGLLVGTFNAVWVIGIGIDSIVVTLGTGTLLTGVQLAINSTTTSGISQTLVDAIRTDLLGLPLGFYYGTALTFLFWYVFQYTPLGRYVFFVGAGRDVARLAGINVDRIRGGSLIVSGFISALAGVVLGGTLSASDPNVSASYLLPAFAAVFLGATAIRPGRFNEWGTYIAVYFLITGITGLELSGLSGWIEQVYYGASLILAVALSTLAARRQARR
jgi:ribose transport system permease protein